MKKIIFENKASEIHIDDVKKSDIVIVNSKEKFLCTIVYFKGKWNNIFPIYGISYSNEKLFECIQDIPHACEFYVLE